VRGIRSRSLGSQRGSSFVEILIALAILALLMVGVLQLFSVSLLTNIGSASRTELTYKAQQVVENLRVIYAMQRAGVAALVNDSGVPAALAVTAGPIFLPYEPSGGSPATTLKWAYWGPAGANIVEEENLPFRLFYTVENGPSPAYWLVTVTATPVDNPNLAVAAPATARRYLGDNKLRTVTYVAQIER
jgi:hypothetical protein